MDIKVTFPGPRAVNAEIGGFIVKTDQPVSQGGNGEFPSPFALFLSSLATCAGFYAMRFCQERDISTEGMDLVTSYERNPETGRLEKVAIKLTTPDGFPEKYNKAIIRAVDQCTVKRTIMDPPEFDIEVTS